LRRERISTRTIQYKAKYLLVDEEDKELDALNKDQVRNLINENLAERNLVDSFLLRPILNNIERLIMFFAKKNASPFYCLADYIFYHFIFYHFLKIIQ